MTRLEIRDCPVCDGDAAHCPRRREGELAHTDLGTDGACPAERVLADEGPQLPNMLAGWWRRREFQLLGVAAALVLAAWIVQLADGPVLVRYVCAILAGILASTQTGPGAWESLRHARLDIDFLMFVAAGGALALGHPEEGSLLLLLFGFGAAGEHMAMGHAERALGALSALAPDTALVLADDGPEPTETPVESVAVGARIVVRPYARVPLDAEVVEGASAFDESTLTGESIPVAKAEGDAIFAGTLNGTGRVTALVTRSAQESTLARIMRLVSEAQANKSPAQVFVERVERWYVPGVFVAALVVLLAQPLLFEVAWKDAFYRAMAFLTAASPCALAIGIPATMLCAVAKSARLGILVKGGVHLDTLARLGAIAYDKTGTLTVGRPRVLRVAVAPGFAEDEVLGLVAAVETEVSHPLAEAIVRAAESRGLELGEPTEVQQVAGAGAEGVVAGRRVRIGRRAFAWPEGAEPALEMPEDGASLVRVGIDGRAAGVLALGDEIRASSADAIAELRRMGVSRQVMLTGDHPAAARAVAEAVGLDAWEAELHPEEKLERLRGLHDAVPGATVAMVGDGVNDAPALAAADVGIAMGAAGAEVALETADVAIMGSTLGRLPTAVRLARRARRTSVQNLAIALAVIGVVAPLAALGHAHLGVAVVLHEGSTVVVVLNALRLLGFRDSRPA